MFLYNTTWERIENTTVKITTNSWMHQCTSVNTETGSSFDKIIFKDLFFFSCDSNLVTSSLNPLVCLSVHNQFVLIDPYFILSLLLIEVKLATWVLMPFLKG